MIFNIEFKLFERKQCIFHKLYQSERLDIFGGWYSPLFALIGVLLVSDTGSIYLLLFFSSTIYCYF